MNLEIYRVWAGAEFKQECLVERFSGVGTTWTRQKIKELREV